MPAQHSNCAADIEAIFPSTCDASKNQACGGTIVRCLREGQNKIVAQGCKTALKRVLKWQAQDCRLVFILNNSCAGDVQKFCSEAKVRTEGAIHRCLRDNAQELFDKCRIEEFRLKKIETYDTAIQPRLQRACSGEVQASCDDVK